jgi:hypothetical protein
MTQTTRSQQKWLNESVWERWKGKTPSEVWWVVMMMV